MKPRITALLCSLFLTTPLAAFAHEGHDHGEPEAPPAETPTETVAETETATEAPDATAKRPELPGTPSARGAGGRAITAFDRPGQRGIGGYFAQEFTLPSNGPAYFDQRQMVLQASAFVHDSLFFNTEIEYEHGGDPLKGGEVKLEQAWGEWMIDDAFNFRSGIVLIPVGRLNVLHDADYREATTRPMMTRQIIPSTWFEAGAGARGAFDVGEEGELNYEAYVTQGLTNRIATATGTRAARPDGGKDVNPGKAVSARVGYSPWLGMEMGLSGYATPYNLANEASTWMGLGAVDLQWQVGPFQLVGEAALVGTQGGTFTQNDQTVTIPGSMGGYYLEGHYSFFPEFLRESFLGKGLGFTDPRFTAFARWGQVDTDFSQLTNEDRSEIVIGLNYRPVPNTAIKVEWLHETQALSGAVTNSLVSSLAMGF